MKTFMRGIIAMLADKKDWLLVILSFLILVWVDYGQ